MLWTVMRSVKKDIALEQCINWTISPWVSQTLTRPILWTAVKYIRKIVTRTKIGDKGIASTFQLTVATFQNWVAKTD